MKHLFRVSRALLSTYYAYMVEYRAELILWALSGSLPFILMGVWTQAAEKGNFGLSSLEFARYFLAIYLVRQLTVVWVIWDFERQIIATIRSGLASRDVPYRRKVCTVAVYTDINLAIFLSVSNGFLGTEFEYFGFICDR
jgi:hypothetical protein